MADNSGVPRVPRRLLVVPDHPHHLILRGNNRRRLFSYPREYRYFLLRLLRAEQKYSLPVHTVALMSNHTHLIVTPQKHQHLSSFVRSFAQTYSQFRNRNRSSSGKLFEERYKCVPIVSEKQMAVTNVYVELNSVHADICADPALYRWTTFALHAALPCAEPLLADLWKPSSWYTSLGGSPAARAAVYREWFAHYRARDHWSDVWGLPKRAADRKRFERPDRTKAI